jgi:large subunit ribosomal protein L30
MSARLRLTLRRSTVGTNPSARGTVRALGLHRIGQTVELSDDAATRGQVRAVRFLLDVEEMAAPAARAASTSHADATMTSTTDRKAGGSGRGAAPPRRASSSSKGAPAPAPGSAAPASKKEAQS